ncbi:MAG TPA: flagellar basal body rod protein FlgB [Opitutaceae bacterium]|jgi:flagellar basal-body rod protein FlgB
MIDPIFQSDNMSMARKLLDASAMRQDAIAANLANLETPGYHRVDVDTDFAAKLKASYEAGTLNSPTGISSINPLLTEDKTARAVRTDGNNVEMEHELLAMNRNSVEYSYLTDVVTYNIKQLKMAIAGQA